MPCGFPVATVGARRESPGRRNDGVFPAHREDVSRDLSRPGDSAPTKAWRRPSAGSRKERKVASASGTQHRGRGEPDGYLVEEDSGHEEKEEASCPRIEQVLGAVAEEVAKVLELGVATLENVPVRGVASSLLEWYVVRVPSCESPASGPSATCSF